MTIWKYPIEIDDRVDIEMPRNAQLIYVGDQAGQLTVWAMVDDRERPALRTLLIRGTGHPCPDDAPYVGSAQVLRSSGYGFVWHVFDGGERPAN